LPALNLKKLSFLAWENWPRKLFYLPLLPVWAWYMLRSRSIWFFTPANVSITFGGFEGESKEEMYEKLPKSHYPTTFYVRVGDGFDSVCQRIEAADMLFPLAVKPNIGNSGFLFRKINTIEQLEEYHRITDVEYMVQAFIAYPLEVSIYYYRMPGQGRGTIAGFLQKMPMYVVGDGKSTLEQLVATVPQGKRPLAEIKRAHETFWKKVIPLGHHYQLSDAANRTQGGRFVSLKHEIDENLQEVCDQLSHTVRDWYFGRWDIMCQSVADLKIGRNYAILEYNGAGAAPNHLYQNGYTLGYVYSEILKYWKALYDISKASRRLGVKPWSTFAGWRMLNKALRHIDHIKEKDRELSF
jgi:hypothetical protein